MLQPPSESSEQPSRSSVSNLLGQTLGGRYKIISHLGGGGYGQTYLAEDIHLPKHPRCVVKQLRPQATNKLNLQIASRLFNTEAEVLYKLGSHPQIPRLFAHFEDREEFYLVQEFIEGIDLKHELVIGQHMREQRVVNLMKEILQILEFVHAQSVIHRDINPRNLIRRKTDKKLVLIDFGSVKKITTKVIGGDKAVNTVAIGTAGYMPLEQINGNPHFCSDIYAVGIVAVQALTGLDPSRNQLPINPQNAEVEWQDLAVVGPELAKIINRAIKANHTDRYQTAGEVLKDIHKWQLAHQPNEASLTSSIEVKRPPRIPSRHSNKDSINNNAYYSIDVLPRSHGDRLLKWWPILGILFVAGIALLLKSIDLNNSQPNLANVPATPSIATQRKPSLIPPLAAPIPTRKLSDQEANRVARLIKTGDRLIESGKYREAIEAYNDALAIKDAYEEAAWGKCYAFISLQQYQEAIAACNRSLQINSKYDRAWWGKGYALDALKRYDEALAHYEKAIEIKPDFAEALLNQGATLTVLGRYEEALAAYDKALQQKPTLAEAWNNRGVVLEHLGQQEKAIASFNEAIRLNPDYQLAIQNRQRSQK
ncbi:MAG: tetratricopeptide repeat protein [Cyanosarcina radialis HA8281-LM2]|nr:tetratricopeptide repeat protein [Cyanosarcina radialis HA8281-LM2]